MKLLLMSAFGVLGVWLRFFLDQFIVKKFPSPFPLGIFIINILGCVLVGALYAFYQKEILSSEVTQIIGVGFLGALTTFSTFSLDIFKLLFIQNQVAIGIIYGVGSPTVGILGTWSAFKITTYFLGLK